MKKIAYRPYLFLFSLIFFSLSMPQGITDHVRAGFVRLLGFSHLFATEPVSFELENLIRENQLLRTQLESVREWVLSEDRMEKQIQRLKIFADIQDDFFKRRSAEIYNALNLQLQSLPAKVIFREPSSWSSTLWLNVGEKDNERLNKKIVGKNSPVLAGGSIIGVVEYVGKTRSRIRLLTDSSLVPSVRAIRGSEQNRFLLDHVDALLSALESRDDIAAPMELAEHLILLKEHLSQIEGDHFMAKGELHGTSYPLWRSRSQVLRGIGFNYDYADRETAHRNPSNAILKAGDLLVTTGMDGIFPPGFRIATVTKVAPLKEGSSSYELEARACAGNLDELKEVYVLPTIGIH